MTPIPAMRPPSEETLEERAGSGDGSRAFMEEVRRKKQQATYENCLKDEVQEEKNPDGSVRRTSQGTHTATPESRGSIYTPTKGRSADQQQAASSVEAPLDSGLGLPLSASPTASSFSLGGGSHASSESFAPHSGLPSNFYRGSDDDKRYAPGSVTHNSLKPGEDPTHPAGAAHASRASTMSKVLGRADVIIGKATSNDDKIQEGYRKQRGESK